MSWTVTAPDTIVAPPGATALVTVVVTNTGSDQTVGTLTATAGPDGSGWCTVENPTRRFGPGASRAFLLAISPPDDAPAGVHRAAVTVTVTDEVTSRSMTLHVPRLGAQLLSAEIPDQAFPQSVAVDDDGRVSRVLVDGAALWTVDVEHGRTASLPLNLSSCRSVSLGRDGAVAHVVGDDGQQLVVQTVDLATLTVTASVPLGGRLFDVAVSPDGGRAWVASSLDTSLGVVDLATGTWSKIPIGEKCTRVVVSPAGDRVFVLEYDAGTASVVDAATSRAIAMFTVGPGPWEMSVSADGRRLAVLLGPSGPYTLAVFDVETMIAVATVPISGHRVLGLVLAADGRRAWVGVDQTVAIVDVDHTTVTAVPAGMWVQGLAVDRHGFTAHVVGSTGYRVGVIRVIDLG